MNAKEAYLRIFNYLGEEPRAKILTEHKHVYSMRLRPGERLCVRKDTGEVLWEDDLPDELYPIGRGMKFTHRCSTIQTENLTKCPGGPRKIVPNI